MPLVQHGAALILAESCFPLESPLRVCRLNRPQEPRCLFQRGNNKIPPPFPSWHVTISQWIWLLSNWTEHFESDPGRDKTVAMSFHCCSFLVFLGTKQLQGIEHSRSVVLAAQPDHCFWHLFIGTELTSLLSECFVPEDDTQRSVSSSARHAVQERMSEAQQPIKTMHSLTSCERTFTAIMKEGAQSCTDNSYSSGFPFPAHRSILEKKTPHNNMFACHNCFLERKGLLSAGRKVSVQQKEPQTGCATPRSH